MKFKIKGNRDKQIGLAFITLSALFVMSVAGNVLSGSLAWHFYKTRDTIITPMAYNQPYRLNTYGGDTTALSMFAMSFASLRLSVSPESIDTSHRVLLRFVPSESRDALKKVLDVEADRIKKGGITTRFDLQSLSQTEDGAMAMTVKLSSSTTNGGITTALPDQLRTYRINMAYENGIIRLLEFSELKPTTT
ncbi:TraE/TraK family type IV conjugative transfer system protein [Scandinavium sp. NPDC088450]|uniref:TraE/TraK family type IV conjugative transfer system protein n=1 Tax=Scandinavium sp. NPDC088450 TaxID=3364514 RepID=UPI0038515B70